MTEVAGVTKPAADAFCRGLDTKPGVKSCPQWKTFEKIPLRCTATPNPVCGTRISGLVDDTWLRKPSGTYISQMPGLAYEGLHLQPPGVLLKIFLGEDVVVNLRHDDSKQARAFGAWRKYTPLRA
jgi:hypothetical protein